MYLGIDPGKNGGAVLLDSAHTLVQAWWWQPCKAGGYEVQSQYGDALGFWWHSLTELGGYLPTLQRVAVEGLFAGRARQAIIGTAETAGELLGAIAPKVEQVLRPPASRWRADLLRLPGGTKAAQADRYARQVVVARFGELEAWRCGHAVDAACIALWAAGVRGKR